MNDNMYIIGSDKPIPDWLQLYMDDGIIKKLSNKNDEWIMDRDYAGHETITLRPWDILVNTEEGIAIIFSFYSFVNTKTQSFQSS